MLSERDSHDDNQPGHSEQDEAGRDAGDEPVPEGVEVVERKVPLVKLDYLTYPDLN